MNELTIYDKILYTFIAVLTVFIIGVQVGIAHGKELQRQEYYDYILAD